MKMLTHFDCNSAHPDTTCEKSEAQGECSKGPGHLGGCLSCPASPRPCLSPPLSFFPFASCPCSLFFFLYDSYRNSLTTAPFCSSFGSQSQGQAGSPEAPSLIPHGTSQGPMVEHLLCPRQQRMVKAKPWVRTGQCASSGLATS